MNPRRVVLRAQGGAAGLAAALALLAAGRGAISQEVRINDYWGGLEDVLHATVSPSGFRFAWKTQGWICSTDAVTREVDSRGRFLSGDVQVAPACDLGGAADVAVLPSGSFIVVGRRSDGTGYGIFAWLFDQASSPLGPPFAVSAVTTQPPYWPRVAALAGGRYAVVWEDLSTNPQSISGRIVMEDGSMPYPQQPIVEIATTVSEAPVVAASPGGGAIVAWHQYTANMPPSTDIKARLFDDTMSPVSSEVIVSPGVYPVTNGRPDVAASPIGYVVTWTRGDLSPNSFPKALLLDLAGAPKGPELQVNTTAGGTQYYPFCGMDASGNFVIVWTAPDEDWDGATAQRFDATGNKVGTEFRANGTTYSGQGATDIVMLASGDFLITWASLQDPNGRADSFMRRYFFPVSLVVGPGRGPTLPPTVQTLLPDGRFRDGEFAAYGSPGYGANVGAGDVNGDGIAEVLAGPGPSPAYGPQVRAFRPDGNPVAKVNYYAYGTLRYGVRPAGGSFDGDAYAEILTAPGEGQVFGPHVRGFDYDGTSLQPIGKVSFFAYGTLKFGARAVGGDIDGDGMAELVSAPGPGFVFGPQIRAFDYDGASVRSLAKVNFNAFSGPLYGATVGAADVESDGEGGYGDGYQEILAGVGPDPGVNGQVSVFDYDGASVAAKVTISPYPSTRYGSSVAGGDVDAGDTEEVVTAPGPDAAAMANVVVWEWDNVVGTSPDGPLQRLGPDDFIALPSGALAYGANIAVGTFE